jgi:hypothetical protein
MPTFRGSCHCGRVTFEVEASPSELSECNCSLCRRKGAVYLKISEVDSLRILSGESELSVYRFNTNTAKHYFCRICGVHPFHRSRFAPERWSVNARCLDDFDVSAYPRTTFDGQNWERSARAEGWRG